MMAICSTYTRPLFSLFGSLKQFWKTFNLQRSTFNVYVVTIVLIILSAPAFSQHDTINRRSIVISPFGGFIIPHHKSMSHLIQGHSYGVHIYAKKRVNGTKYWHEAYNLPEHGVDGTFTNTGNPSQLGQQYAVSYLLNLTLNGRRYVEDYLRMYPNGFRHWIGLGIGMGYTTRPWNLETNHQAAVLGSRFNVALSLQYSARVASFKHGELRMGIRISHLSNGAFQLPNLGTNNAGVFVSYAVGKSNGGFMKGIEKPSIEKNSLSLGVVSGLKEIPPPTGRKYSTLVLSVLGERRICYKSAFGIGLDGFYDSSLRPLIEQRSGVEPSAREVMQLGAVVSYSLFFDRFALKIQQGFYVLDAQRVNGNLYHRAGLRYSIGKHMYAQLTLKTHFAKADYGELGIGYILRK